MSGESARVASRSSRISCSASTVCTSAPSSAARRRARSSGSAVRNTFSLGVGGDDGADIASLGDPVAVVQQPPLLGDHRRADGRLRGRFRRRLGDLGGADRLGHVAPVEHDPLGGRLDPHVGATADGCSPRSKCRQGNAAVHGAGVEIRVAEPVGNGARDRRLPRSGRTIDRDTIRTPTGRCRRRILDMTRGRLHPDDFDALLRGESGNRAEQREPVVAVGVDPPAAQRRRRHARRTRPGRPRCRRRARAAR